MNVVAGIDKPAGIIKIGQHGFAVGVGFRLGNVNRRTGGAEIDLLAMRVQIVLGILAVKLERPVGVGDGVLDQSPRDQDPALAIDGAAHGGHRFDAARYRLIEADGLQNIESRFVNALHAPLAQGLVLPTKHARLNGRLVERYGGCPQGLAGGPAAAAPGGVFNNAHGLVPLRRPVDSYAQNSAQCGCNNSGFFFTIR